MCVYIWREYIYNTYVYLNMKYMQEAIKILHMRSNYICVNRFIYVSVYIWREYIYDNPGIEKERI